MISFGIKNRARVWEEVAGAIVMLDMDVRLTLVSSLLLLWYVVDDVGAGSGAIEIRRSGDEKKRVLFFFPRSLSCCLLIT